jgi:ABC-type dipeptide/oligopeptide/nickel transport system permease subunit
MALIGLSFLVFEVVCAIFAPFIALHDPYQINVVKVLQPPNSEYWFGTDSLGRCVFSRVIYGARISLMIGLLTSMIATLIGLIIGSLAGYYGGVLDMILMRVSDSLLIIPSFFLYLFFIVTFRAREWYFLVLIMSLLLWPRLAKLMRSDILSLRERPFIMAAKALGLDDFKIILRHIIPNELGVITVTATLNMAVAIMIEGSLSFLGLGDPTLVSWGNLIAMGQQVFGVAWWLITFPGLALFLTVLSMNFLGDGIRDAVDPKLKLW